MDIKDGDDDDFNDGNIGASIGNDTNCGDGEGKVNCSEDTVADDSNSNVDGDPNDDGGSDTNHGGRDGDDSDGESNGGLDRHKNGNDYDDGCLDSVKIWFKSN